MNSIQPILPTASNTIVYSTFGEYVRANRFRSIDALSRIEREFAICRSKTPNPSKLVLVHAPYPEDGEMGEAEFIVPEEAREVSSGQGCGKSDLLTLIQEWLSKRDDCRVIAFLDNRDKVADGIDFYKDVFLEELANLDRTLVSPIGHRLAGAAEAVFSLLQRVSLLVYVAIPVFAAVIGYILTLLGFKAIEFFVDPKNLPILVQVTAWFERNQGLLFTVAVLGFLLWIFYAWGALQRDERLLLRWRELGQWRSEAERASELKEKLANDPEQILRRFASHGQTLVLLVDDVDVMDGFNFQALLGLYEEAVQSQKWSLLLILTYNPRNPTLYRPDKSAIRLGLDPVMVNEQHWTSIQLEPPKSEHLRTWLWGYYRHPRAAELLGVLERTYLEARAISLVLSFFIVFDRQLGDRTLIAEVNDDRLKQEFERYLNRDRRIAQDIINTIAQSELAEGCLEMLKYILAFKRPQVRVEHVKAIMARTSYNDFDAYEKILLSDQVNLLRKTYIDGYPTYVFRQPYLRSMLDTSWKQWRDNAHTYYTEVFLGLHRLPRVKDNPDLALEAAPSKLAVDVLYREGEYFYKYYGSSDAGYALRFYGLERGGALGKWLKLCEDTIANQENLWELIRWKSEARINPLRHWSGEVYSVWSFAPDLVLTAGRLYWMSGRWKTAAHIWTYYWPWVRDQLPPAPIPELAERVREADAEIRAALAEMLYAVGQPGSWDQANALCLALRQQTLPRSQASCKADLILALVRHYRAVGVGNNLLPYRFLRPDVKLDLLKAACEIILTTEVDRLRPLHVMAESLWQILVPPPYVFPLDIELDKIEPLEVDSAIFEQFVQVLKEEQQTLEAILEYRKSRKRGTLPGGRVKEGDLLFWEGMFLLQRARHFRLKAWQEFGKYSRIFRDKKRSEVQQRFNTYYAIANLLNDFCRTGLLDRRPPAQFAELMYQLEEIERKWPAGQVDAMQREERKARGIAERLYRLGWVGIVEQAKERLQMAEAIYRRLGCQQGIAAVAFARALAAHEYSAPTSFGKRPLWVDEFERFVHYSSGELGYHLDALRAHVIVGQWASERDLYRAVQEFQSADTWAPSERIGLPKAHTGEINFRIGDLIGNMEATPFPDDYVFAVFDKAARSLDDLGDHLPYIGENDIVDRRLTIHWWLAELSLRKAWSEANPIMRERHLRRVEVECRHVINQARGLKDRANRENQARLVLGQAIVAKGPLCANREEADRALCNGYEEVERALKYFQAEGNSFFALQALTRLVRWAVYSDSKDKRWPKCTKRCQNQYLPALFALTEEYLGRVALLDPRERLILYRAGHLLGKLLAEILCTAEGARLYDQALRWLNACFDILESLSLFGTAILLDNDIRPLYEKAGDVAGLETHKKRILEAAQRLDPMREKIPFSLISPILRRYAKVVFAESQHITTKRECLDRAKHALWREEPEIGPAIELLERARSLIDLHKPEDIDIDILGQLTVTYYRQGDPATAREVGEVLALVQSTIQSRDFLALAEHYKVTGGDYEWALKIAVEASPPNEYSIKAQATLGLVQIPSGEEAGPPSEGVEAVEITLDTSELLSKPSSEFDAADCYQLLRWLERELRSLIVDELSKLTPKWWKQRVPPDTRSNAEARKQEREKPYPGRAQQDLPLHEYLDFSDYIKIITMKLNWDDVFKRIFVRQELVTVKLGEIKVFRDDVAHMRELSLQDREVFITNARQLLRAIMGGPADKTTSADQEKLPLDTPQLAGGRKRARRRREPGCNFRRSVL